MEKYQFDSHQLQKILEKTIDLFLEYQYKRGYDEPQARSQSIMDVIGTLRGLGGRPAPQA